jgi:hypothetical protein
MMYKKMCNVIEKDSDRPKFEKPRFSPQGEGVRRNKVWRQTFAPNQRKTIIQILEGINSEMSQKAKNLTPLCRKNERHLIIEHQCECV